MYTQIYSAKLRIFKAFYIILGGMIRITRNPIFVDNKMSNTLLDKFTYYGC